VTSSTFDALIIGGGPGGATSALLLAKAGWSVALVEKATFPRGKVCGEFLSATNLPLLRHLGMADSFLELAGPDVRQVGLFSGDHAVTADMPRPRTGARIGDAWGRALGRDHLDTLLLQRAAARGNPAHCPRSRHARLLGHLTCLASRRIF
jgi:2-polyprenyl-6-methoxyphenol hydroxylase-like FAD-dependent oxidoreductase